MMASRTLKFRNVIFSLLVALCAGQFAFSQTFEFQKKPESLAFKNAGGTIVASLPIDLVSFRIAFFPGSGTFYVYSKDRYVTSVNAATGKVDRVIKVPNGKYERVELLMSHDGRRLFCYTASTRMVTGGDRVSLPSPSIPSTYDLRHDSKPLITIIDTQSNQVIGTYDWFGGLRSAWPKADYFENRFFATSDGGHLIAEFHGITKFSHSTGQQLAIFSQGSTHPTYTMDPGGDVIGMMLSQDEGTLLVAADAVGQTSGLIDSVNLATGIMTKHTLPDRPTKLLRLGADHGMWAIGSLEMRSVSETGELGDKPIPLNRPRKAEAGDTESASAFLNGYPGETINIGSDHAAILITNNYGASMHRVALLDLKQLLVDSIVPTMTPAELAKLRTSKFLTGLETAAIMGAVNGAVGAGAGTPVDLFPGYVPNMGLANEALAARPDGLFLYVLDTDAHEVTVIDVKAAAMLSRIPVEHAVVLLQLSSDGKDLLCLGKKVQQKINLNSNTLEN